MQNSINSIVSSLVDDHKYMIKLLYLLDSEIKSLSGLSRVSVDVDKLLEIEYYLENYSKMSHHGIEDAMFHLLAAKPLKAKETALIDHVLQEHEKLAVLQETLEELITLCLTDNRQNALLLRISQQYIKMQIEHINCEQNSIYPLCEQHLSESDWQQVKTLARKNEQEQTQELSSMRNSRQALVLSHAATAA